MKSFIEPDNSVRSDFSADGWSFGEDSHTAGICVLS